MVIIKTPFRISFFGGGTDFEDYYMKFGGSVISTTIDKYCYVTLRHLPKLFEYKNQLTYSKIERFNNPRELKHPLVRNALQFIPVDNIQISYDADLPAGSGIGSSSSFAVGLIQGLYAMKNQYPDKMQLAEEAIYLERVLCDEAGGVQDQIAAAFGGFNRYFFSKDGFEVKPVLMSSLTEKQLEENLLLVFTGFTHFAGEISKNQKDNIKRTSYELEQIKLLTDNAEQLLLNGRCDDFGRLLNETWQLKKSLSTQITNNQIDEIYDIAIKNGALGGKLLGAGSGGFMLLYVTEENRDKVKSALNNLNFEQFRFEKNGTTIFYDNRE